MRGDQLVLGQKKKPPISPTVQRLSQPSPESKSPKQSPQMVRHAPPPLQTPPHPPNQTLPPVVPSAHPPTQSPTGPRLPAGQVLPRKPMPNKVPGPILKSGKMTRIGPAITVRKPTPSAPSTGNITSPKSVPPPAGGSVGGQQAKSFRPAPGSVSNAPHKNMGGKSQPPANTLPPTQSGKSGVARVPLPKPVESKKIARNPVGIAKDTKPLVSPNAGASLPRMKAPGGNATQPSPNATPPGPGGNANKTKMAGQPRAAAPIVPGICNSICNRPSFQTFGDLLSIH